MTHRFAETDDLDLLAELNAQLIQDEGHQNTMTRIQLRERMSDWLQADYRAVLFQDDRNVVAYALYRVRPDWIHLRQFFVARRMRRRGVGRSAFSLLRDQVWPGDKRLTVDALTANLPAIGFWRAMGFRDYSLSLEITPAQEPTGGPEDPRKISDTKAG